MKKLLTLALAVLGISAAQAVNIAWTNRNVNADADWNNGAWAVGKNTAGTPLASVTVGDSGLYEGPTGVGTNYTAEKGTSFTDYQSAKITSVAMVIGGSKNTWLTGNNFYLVIQDANGNKAISSAVGTRSGSFKVYAGEEAASTSHQSSGTALTFTFAESSTLDLAAGDYDFWFTTDAAGEVYATGQANDTAQTIFKNGVLAMEIQATATAVPEPTVLALLALGVAGVALRRKKVVA